MTGENSANSFSSLKAYPYFVFELPDRFRPKKLDLYVQIPDLLEVQKKSYEMFLQEGIPPEQRQNVGIHRVLSTLVFEVKGKRLEYVDYELTPPKYTPEECKARELTYDSIMRVKMRLISYEDEENTKIKQIREEWVYFGEIPRLSPKCSFIIGGTEKVVVSQLHKSPGVYFEYDKYKLRTASRFVPIARIVPYRGQWIDFDFDLKDILYVRLQKKKRMNAWIFLKAIGFDLEDLLDIYEKEEIILRQKNARLEILKEVKPDIIRYQRASMNYKGIISKGGRFTLRIIEELKNAGVMENIDGKLFIPISEDEFPGESRKEVINFGVRVLAQTIKKNGKEFKAGTQITEELINELLEAGVDRFQTVWYDDVFVSGSIIKTYKEMEKKLKIKTREEAAVEFFRRTRPGEPTDPHVVFEYVRAMFMSASRFNLSRVGRVRISKRFDIEIPIEIVIQEDGKILKKIVEGITEFQVASEEIDLGDGQIIPAGERIRREYIKKLMERGVMYIPISEAALSEYAPCEDIKDENGEIIAQARRNLGKFTIGKLKEAAKNKGKLVFNAFWYPESLTYLDIFSTIKYLFDIRFGKPGKTIDDVDNLANRRVRPVGELAEMELLRGIERIRRSILEKLRQADPDKTPIKEIVNFKPAASALKEFFAMGQLSQFLDNTNPLSELTHKRRLSALGTGGLKRETAGIEVRDVHSSHYGKICPVETPEGQNVGLITSLTIFSKIDDLGLIRTPYRKVVNGYVTNEIEYLSAIDEEKFPIASYGTEVGPDGKIIPETLPARVGSEIRFVSRDEVKYIDAVPFQILGVSASLIPFFEHDDSNRALMGSNMQRQAVPLLFPEPPVVGVGHEKEVAKNAMAVVVAKHEGIVKYVDANRIVVEVDDPDFPELRGTADIYTLTKWSRTNQSTSINQRPLVRFGERVKRGQIIADGHSTAGGELSLGKNVIVAIMSWRGYNFEDSIVISERLVEDDVYTSVHLEEISVDVRETKYGPEEVTKDVPGVAPDLVANLDEDGIIRVGAFVNPGDILVGKLTPVGEVPLTLEERLLKSIFAKAVETTRETSVRCPPDIRGTVVSVHVHYRKNIVKDQRIKEQEELLISKVRRDMQDAVEILRGLLWERIGKYINSLKIYSSVKIGKSEFSENNLEFKQAFLARLKEYKEISGMLKFLEGLRGSIDDESLNNIISTVQNFREEEDNVRKQFEEKISEIRKGEELPPGVLKRIRILIASKRKIQIGDKLSGRHGNKGVVSIVLPKEDMPFLPDGTPVDIILSPLGIPSRMNIGQLLELQLGWVSHELGKRIAELVQNLEDDFIRKNASEIRTKIKSLLADGEDRTGIVQRFFEFIDSLDDYELLKFVREAERIGVRFAVPPFCGLSEQEIKELGRRVGIPETFTVMLRDGRTGEPFDQPVAVGKMYIMKLIHMVEDKIHARSTGPYSLITQQPLGGKSRGGGQRFGEMEVWALEAYGAAYTLQEMLTVKSDDISGRERTVYNIINGKPVYVPSIPESFVVLMKELQAMGFDVEPLVQRELEEMEESAEEEGGERKMNQESELTREKTSVKKTRLLGRSRKKSK
jgi:DNA-directed RNA polymerase subunit beta